MKLIIDSGNTFVKTAIFDNKKLIYSQTTEQLSTDFLKNLFHLYKINAAIISSVKKVPLAAINFIKKHTHFIELSASTPIPINNVYKTPETLGKDRLAGVIGAYYLFPQKTVLVIDAGTCITYDLINKKGEYYGGSISPGLKMRFNALHTFTQKLPLVSLKNINTLIGTNTNESILTGVINGYIAEIDGIIEQYKNYTAELIVVLCGGDTHFLVNRLKNSIFANPEIVLIGLNEILDYNEAL
ncbi:MAG TPA: type III pantothenate kinase [Bacteroidales bacterium]|nr:type III pantothenate kinase [Bacteroidales bacterium]HQI46462.1 type III pantothenate kinase [Bacteroidales bacterium]